MSTDGDGDLTTEREGWGWRVGGGGGWVRGSPSLPLMVAKATANVRRAMVNMGKVAGWF